MDRLEVIKILAREAGECALGAFGTEFKMSTKADGSLVTDIDEQCEQIIIDGIRNHFHNDAIVAEESGVKEGASGYTWYIDPIDGTTNFGHRLPIFATSIGITDPEGLSDAAINLPTLSWLLYGSRGKGAFLNGKKIETKHQADFTNAMILFSFPGAVERSTGYEKKVAEIIAMRPKVRVLASAVTQWSFMASGSVDAYFSIGQWPWDCAAGILLALESGVAISTFDGTRISYDFPLPAGERLTLCASAPGIHEEAVALAKTLGL